MSIPFFIEDCWLKGFLLQNVRNITDKNIKFLLMHAIILDCVDVIRIWFYSHFLNFQIVRSLGRLFIFLMIIHRNIRRKLNEKESNVGLRYKARGN